MAHYWPGRSLLELHRGEMSWRELRVFLAHLPPESATARAIRGWSSDEEFWLPERQLLAAAVDAVRELTFATVRLHGDPAKTRDLKAPDPIQRPGVKPRRDDNVIRFGGRHGSGARELAKVFGAPAGA